MELEDAIEFVHELSVPSTARSFLAIASLGVVAKPRDRRPPNFPRPSEVASPTSNDPLTRLDACPLFYGRAS